MAPVQPDLSAAWPGDLAYIDPQGQIVIKSTSTVPDRPDKIEFDLHYYRFCGGIDRVGLGSKENQDTEGYINREGKVIWPPAAPSKKQ